MGNIGSRFVVCNTDLRIYYFVGKNDTLLSCIASNWSRCFPKWTQWGLFYWVWITAQHKSNFNLVLVNHLRQIKAGLFIEQQDHIVPARVVQLCLCWEGSVRGWGWQVHGHFVYLWIKNIKSSCSSNVNSYNLSIVLHQMAELVEQAR